MTGMVGHAGRMMAGTLVSRVLGLAREMMTASMFGASRALDAFYVSYTIANLARQLLAEGALSASFVPVFARTLERDGKAGAVAIARQVMTVLLVGCAVVVLIGMAASPLLVSMIAPGFDPERASLAASLTRQMFPFLLLVSIGALAMGALNSDGSFFVPAVAPAASNAVFIAVIALSSGLGIRSLVAAVLAGGAASTAIQWAHAARRGMLLLPARPDRRDPELRETLRLFLPYAAGMSLNQVNPIISRMLASFLGGGVISALSFADRIIQLPLGLFVIAISQATLPMLSRIDRRDASAFASFARDAVRFALFVVLPAALGLVVLAGPAVHLLLYRGEFNDWAWQATSGALTCYALGLPGMAALTVLMRALYARGIARRAAALTALTVASNLALGTLLMRHFSFRGLALGTSLAFTISAAVGVIVLRRDLGVKIGVLEPVWALRQIICCEIYFIVLRAIELAVPYPSAGGLAVRCAWMAAMLAVALCVYGALTLAARCPEWRWIGGAIGIRMKSEGGDGDDEAHDDSDRGARDRADADAKRRGGSR